VIAALDVLLLRLEGPMMSFGDVAVDALGPTARYPQASMVTGLLANALGVERGQVEVLEGLQASVVYAAREDRRGSILHDYQTVDISAPSVSLTGWTTRGEVEVRGGASGDGTHVRRRQYLENASYAVALTLRPASAAAPTLDAVAAALQRPFRPLFLGRKCCVPTAPVLCGRVTAPSLYAALQGCPVAEQVRPETRRTPPPAPRLLRAWWPEGEGPAGGEAVFATDRRDHRLGMHVGRRALRTGMLQVGP
jgi:CRISPR system Cascade subunit CasD